MDTIQLVGFLLLIVSYWNVVGIAIDAGKDVNDPHSEIMLLRKVGKVSVLSDAAAG